MRAFACFPHIVGVLVALTALVADSPPQLVQAQTSGGARSSGSSIDSGSGSITASTTRLHPPARRPGGAVGLGHSPTHGAERSNDVAITGLMQGSRAAFADDPNVVASVLEELESLTDDEKASLVGLLASKLQVDGLVSRGGVGVSQDAISCDSYVMHSSVRPELVASDTIYEQPPVGTANKTPVHTSSVPRATKWTDLATSFVEVEDESHGPTSPKSILGRLKQKSKGKKETKPESTKSESGSDAQKQSLSCECTSYSCECRKDCFCKFRTDMFVGNRVEPVGGPFAGLSSPTGQEMPNYKCTCDSSHVGGPIMDAAGAMDCDCAVAQCNCRRQCTCDA